MHSRNGQLSKLAQQTFEAVHACAAEPDRWPGTLRMVAKLCGSACCALGIVDVKTGINRLAYQVGFEDRYLQLHSEKYGKLCPYDRLLRASPTGAIVMGNEVIDDPKFWKSEYYREWFKPQNFVDWIGFKALENDHRLIKCALLRDEARGKFGSYEYQLLRKLAPLVCKSLAVSDSIVAHSITEAAYKETLDALAAGVLLVDDSGRVIFMNRTAQDQVTAGDTLTIRDGMLALVNKTAGTPFAEALNDTMLGKAPVTEVAIPSTNGGGLVATVLSFSNGGQTHATLLNAAAIIIVQSALQDTHLPSEAFAGLYHLTPGEMHVVRALAKASEVKDVAADLGLSEQTVKTHLQHVYGKTGTNKQKELLALYAHSVLRLDLPRPSQN